MSTSNYQGTARTSSSDDLQIIEEANRPNAARVRGSAVISGAAVGLGTLLLLELLLLTTGLSGGSLSVAGQESGSYIFDAIAAVIAFFVGGLVAGSSSPYRDAASGSLAGIVCWATIILGTLILSALIGSSLFGALGDVLATQQGAVTNAAQNVEVTQSAVDTFRQSAGVAALGAALTLAACALGGSMGARMKQDGTVNSAGRR